MADVTLKYKGATIGELSESGSKTIETAGKYCEADIGVEYVKPSGGEKVLTKLGEYSVTESVVTVSITATEQMQNCEILYIVADLVLSASDWTYPYINDVAGTGTGSMGYFGKTDHLQQSYGLVHVSAVKGTTSRFVYVGDISNASSRQTGSLSKINFRNYTSGVTFNSGTIEIWGYV